jgi:peptide/nickel transport system ATP-binding protein
VARCAEEVPVLADVEGRSVACHLGGLLTLLRAEHVGKTFGRGPSSVVALDDVSITVREGEAVGLVGPSGSGKTTLARIIAGHLEPDAGAVTVTGDGRRSVQLVAQDPWDALSPRLTVAQLVREPLDISREGSPSARDAEVSAALHTVGLPSTGAFLEARSHELSGGQLQRIALARALVARPKVLVADEPTAMLDASEQARLLVVLRERQAELGIGLVLVSHDLAVVRKVTDRIVVLDRGRVVEEGPSNRVSVAPTSCAGRRLLDAAPRFGPDDPDHPEVHTRSTHT